MCYFYYIIMFDCVGIKSHHTHTKLADLLFDLTKTSICKMQFMQKKGCAEMCNFYIGCFDVSHRSWDENICSCENHTFMRKSHISNLVHHQNLESTLLVASCFPGPGETPSWEMCDFHMGMGSC